MRMINIQEAPAAAVVKTTGMKEAVPPVARTVVTGGSHPAMTVHTAQATGATTDITGIHGIKISGSK
jgi:hypothetical protein